MGLNVVINGSVRAVEEGTKIGEIVKEAVPPEWDYLIVKRGRGRRISEGCVLNTSKGKIVSDLEVGLEEERVEVAWTNADMIAFGPAFLNSDRFKGVPFSRKSLKRGDIFILQGEESYLCIALSGCVDRFDVIGRVNAGFSVLKRLVRGDMIKSVEYKYREKGGMERLSLDSKIRGGMEIFSHIDVDLARDAPSSAESFLFYLKNSNGILTVSERTNAYIRMENPIITSDIPVENNRSLRRRGDVFIRNDGVRRNSIYFYKADRMTQPLLNRIGEVTNGMELVEVAKEDERIVAIPHPSQISVIGMEQSDAGDLLAERGILQERTGDKGEDAIIIAQHPSLTMEIADKLKTEGLSQDKVIYIEFFDEKAPLTIDYVRDVSGLYRDRPLGKLRVLSSSSSLVLLEGEGKKRAIVHENIVKRCEAGFIGVTNMSRPWYGTIGIRLDEDDEYGPTGERLESTNIIGRIIKGLNVLKREMVQTLYFIER
jgi:putative methanogenesis marker protein 3